MSEGTPGVPDVAGTAAVAAETDYGGDTCRGINSKLIRFLRNH
ncbi:endo-alpha-N-acetylgalactosaminidase family protein, partial [Streptomyces sp. NPDC000151]